MAHPPKELKQANVHVSIAPVYNILHDVHILNAGVLRSVKFETLFFTTLDQLTGVNLILGNL